MLLKGLVVAMMALSILLDKAAGQDPYLEGIGYREQALQ
jgi:hypothetical protein